MKWKSNTLQLHGLYRLVLYKACAQSCSTLWDPMDCSPSGSSVHWIFQARILELLQRIFSTQGSNLRLSCLLHWQEDPFRNSATWEAYTNTQIYYLLDTRENIHLKGFFFCDSLMKSTWEGGLAAQTLSWGCSQDVGVAIFGGIDQGWRILPQGGSLVWVKVSDTGPQTFSSWSLSPLNMQILGPPWVSPISGRDMGLCLGDPMCP